MTMTQLTEKQKANRAYHAENAEKIRARLKARRGIEDWLLAKELGIESF